MPAFTLPLYQIDAFTSRRFGGNPAAVVPLDSWPSDELLQAIAAENNLSETAYLAPEANGYRLRWFTPVAEVQLCGHATLAAAHALYDQLGYTAPHIDFYTLSGRLTVWRTPTGYRMDFPADTPLPWADNATPLADILGLAPPGEAYRGKDDLMVVLPNQDVLDALRPNLVLLAAVEQRGLIVTAPGREFDFVSRCFYPRYGIAEDPVTGSAHTLLTPYWAHRLGQTSMRAQQRSARRGELHCTLQGQRVLLDGQAVTYLVGTIWLD